MSMSIHKMELNIRKQFNAFFSLLTEKYGLVTPEIYMTEGCSYGGNSKRLCTHDKCVVCFNKSFASADMAVNWGSKNEKDPRTIFKHSGSKYWFECKCCLHQFLSTPRDIQRGSWCPYCSSKKLCDDKTCSFCMIKSFASCDKSKHLIDDTNPREVFMNSNKTMSFRCENCSHIFSSSPNRINFLKYWCPYCCIPSKTLCSDVDCDKCFKRSFASSQRAMYWSTKNPCKPRDVMLNSHTKRMFTCDICTHEFSTSPHSIQNMNSWCPRCVRKTEVKLYNWLLAKFPDTISQAQFDWCTNPSTNRKLPYDFYIPSIKCIIELDGPQHFIQISNWSDPESQKERDLYKMQLALDRGYAIIRILQEDVFRDRNNWDTNLFAQFEMLSYGRVACVGDKQLYQDHHITSHIDTKHTPY